MSALELAAELARLHPRQRRELLAELPQQRREQLSRLIEAMQPAATRAPSAFAQLIDELTAATPPRPAWQDDADLLARLLAPESAALRARLCDEFGGAGAARLTAHVRALAMVHLDGELRALPDLPARTPVPPRWLRWLARLPRRYRNGRRWKGAGSW